MIVAVIGAAGAIGQVHARHLVALGHQVRVFDPNPVPPDLFPHTMHDGNPWADDVQAVVVATPSYMHLADLENAMAFHKHAFIEKPISMGNPFVVPHVRAFLTKSADNNRIIACGYNLRFHPLVQTARERVKEIDPVWASFVVAQQSEKESYLVDGVIDNWMSHEIDLALHLLGPATLSYAEGDRFSSDIILRHDSGVRSHIHGDYYALPQVRRTCVVGRKGNVNIDFNDDPVTTRHYWEEMKEFCSVLGTGTISRGRSLATGAEALAVLEICEAATRTIGSEMK